MFRLNFKEGYAMVDEVALIGYILTAYSINELSDDFYENENYELFEWVQGLAYGSHEHAIKEYLVSVGIKIVA